MFYNKKIYLPAFMIFAFVSSLMASQEELFISRGSAGNSFSFLDQSLSTRAIGMGDAFNNINADPSSVFYNPSGISYIESATISMQGSFLGFNLENGRFNYDQNHFIFAIAAPLNLKNEAVISDETIVVTNVIESFNGLGFGFLNYNIPDISGYDSLGISTGIFSYNTYAVFLAYAHRGIDETTLGFTLKGAYESLKDTKSYGIGLDAGAAFNIGPIRISTFLKDFLTFFFFPNQTSLPKPKILIGLSNLILKDGYIFTIQIEQYLFSRDSVFSLGLEYPILLSSNEVLINEDIDREIGGSMKNEENNFDLQTPITNSNMRTKNIKNFLVLRGGLRNGKVTLGTSLIINGFNFTYAFKSDEFDFNSAHSISLSIAF